MPNTPRPLNAQQYNLYRLRGFPQASRGPYRDIGESFEGPPSLTRTLGGPVVAIRKALMLVMDFMGQIPLVSDYDQVSTRIGCANVTVSANTLPPWKGCLP